ncbi:MAG TPA: hypothetical protein VFV52_03500 [Bacilli bacterium]|nr:hypothetical protein [Bacilli bacterium]
MGLGQVFEGKLRNCTNAVIDNDQIDMPIDDRDQYAITSHERRNSHQVNLHDIAIQNVDTNSTVAVGDNDQNAWKALEKINAGYGVNNGWNRFTHSVNQLVDNDGMDTLVDDRDFKPSVRIVTEE